MLRKYLIAIIMVTFTITLLAVTSADSAASAQRDCPSQDGAVCAQPELSLPIPSEEEIVPPDGAVEGRDQENSEKQDNDNNNNGNTFLLPFP